MQLLSYSEFKKIVDFTDNVNDDRFNKYERTSEKTYLSDLIGADFVTALVAGSYSELLPYVRDCLAHEIELYFIKTGSTIVTGQGAIARKSDYSERPVFVDNKNKIEAVYTILRRCEENLFTAIAAGTYTEFNDNTDISRTIEFSFLSVGDDE